MVEFLDPAFTILTDQQGDALSVNSDGSLPMSPVDGSKFTYSLPTVNITPAASATDIYILNGGVGKTVRVLRVEITGIQTTAGQITLILLKRLTPNAGGTILSSGFGVSHDTNNPQSVAFGKTYSANPTTLGVSAGFVRIAKMFVPAALTASAPTDLVWEFGNRPGQAMVLRGPNEGLAINLNGATVTGGNFNASIEWTEE